MRERAQYVTVFLALAGMALCGANFFGAELFCATAGCKVYTWGKGFYLLGAGGFLTILALVLQERRLYTSHLMVGVIGAGLAIDATLLGYQFLLWPCSSCLMIALIFGLTAAAAASAYREVRRGWVYALAGIWMVCFCAVGMTTAKDLLFKPWCLAGSENAEIRVYFSPSCSNCEDVVKQLVETVEDLDQVGFYPVAKNAEDKARIARILPLAADPKTRAEALMSLFRSEEDTECSLGMKELFGLWCNKVTLARTGRTTIPEIVAPKLLVAKNEFALPGIYKEMFNQPSGGSATCSAVETESSCE